MKKYFWLGIIAMAILSNILGLIILFLYEK
jgi:hypothetical protein